MKYKPQDIPKKWRDLLALLPGYDSIATAEDCWFDSDAAEQAIEFFPECLHHVEGDIAGTPFVLQPWQQAVNAAIFGWKRKDDKGRDVRRYREVFIYVARGNGKTCWIAGLCLYTLICDGEPGAQIYGAAAEREQAALLFRQAKGMVEQEPELASRCKVFGGLGHRSIVLNADPASSYRVLSSDAACLHPDTLLDMPNGSRRKAKEIKAGDTVLGWHNDKLAFGVVANTQIQNPSPIYHIKTHRGRSIRVTGDHKFLVMTVKNRRQDLTHEYEWKRACDIAIGDRVRVALGWPEHGEQPGWDSIMSSGGVEESWALGAWAGDGECGRFRFTSIDDEIVSRLRSFVVSIGSTLESCFSTRQKESGKHLHQYPIEHAIVGRGRRTKSPGREWIRERFGQEARSHTKIIPEVVMRGGPDAWAAFMAGYLDTDGTVPTRGGMASWTSVSEEMLVQCQALLARLGINASVNNRMTVRVCGGEQLIEMHRIIAKHSALSRKVNLLSVAAFAERKKGFNAHQADRVTEISIEPDAETISIEVDGIDTHVTNGLITHNTKHGFNTHVAIVDELHAHPNGDLVSVLRTSMGKSNRKQPLMIYITTADYDRPSVCNQKYEYACKVRDRIFDDPQFLPVVYEVPRDADWRDEKVWHLANPNLGISVSLEHLRSLCKQAQEVPAEENDFRRLHLNQKTTTSEKLIPMDQWDACAEPLDLATLEGRTCYLSIDVGAMSDFCAASLIFPRDDNETVTVERETETGEKTQEEVTRRSYDVSMRFWLPEHPNKRDSRMERLIDGWIKQGYIQVTPGNVVDYDLMLNDIMEWAAPFAVMGIVFDRGFQGMQLGTNLKKYYGDVVEWFPQGILSMNAPFRECLELIACQRLHHDGNPVMRWMVSNTVAERRGGLIKPSKDKSEEKIDGVTALVMGIGKASQDVASSWWNP